MKKNTLFFLRTYNDIDHIVPVIWKASISGWLTYILFVEKDYSDDYRIRFILGQGATLLKGRPVLWYHTWLRRFLVSRVIRQLCDRMVAYSFGIYFLVRYKIQVMVNEWSGPYGRGRAEYYLRVAGILKIPVYSLPHGYSLWTNPFFNVEMSKYYDEKGHFPDFKNRNWFSRYVVQSSEHKATNIKYGMDAEKLIVLGSARFCREWSSINQELLFGENGPESTDRFTILFFLPHWDYNVHRKQCINLLLRIGNLTDVRLVIKAHTRGTGALALEERDILKLRPAVVFVDDDIHSPFLIRTSEVVINFGSSIGFEALRQKKLVINPTYLHDNRTFFDGSKAVYDVANETGVVKLIQELQCGKASTINESVVDQFLLDRVDGGEEGLDVLGDYLNLLSGCYEHTID